MGEGGCCSSATSVTKHPGKLTAYVFFTCFVAATGGLLLGYDTGASVEITAMDPFVRKFFPSAYRDLQDKMARDPRISRYNEPNEYCRISSSVLTTFNSSLYLVALVASIVASWATSRLGRNASMRFGGCIFLVGAMINTAAAHVSMLVVGRILLGVGIGFTNQSAPIYLSEMAPARYRGSLNLFFQLMIAIGFFIGKLVNFGGHKIDGSWSWRVLLAGALVPGLIVSVGSFFLPDTPNSLVHRCPENPEKARSILRRIRGTDDVEEEYNDLVAASTSSGSVVKRTWFGVLKRRNRPQLVMAIFIPFFQQLAGMNLAVYLAPAVFRITESGDKVYLLSALTIGGVSIAATLVAILVVDKFGRKFLFIEGGIQMLIFQALLGLFVLAVFSSYGLAEADSNSLLVFLLCLSIAGFAWSWGPLGWLVPSEIFPLGVRSAGQSINVSVNMLFAFIIAQLFHKMFCHLKFALFFFHGGWALAMTVFICVFFPETKKVPIEKMDVIWKKHWLWRRFLPNEITPAV